jgi:hypothetical protein
VRGDAGAHGSGAEDGDFFDASFHVSFAGQRRRLQKRHERVNGNHKHPRTAVECQIGRGGGDTWGS